MRLPTLWGRDKDDPFSALHREVEKVFEDFTKGWPSFTGNGRRGLVAPDIDIAETDRGLELTAELPGVDEKDIDVTLADNVLTIRGEKRAAHEQKAPGRVISERSYGAFQRSFSLPYEVDASKIEAEFDKGVLRITLPKSPELEQRTQKIAIKGKK